MTAAQAAVGLFDPVHPARCLVLGEAAAAWWRKADARTLAALPARLAAAGVRELICGRGAPALDPAAWQLAGIALGEDRATAAHARLARLRAGLAAATPSTTLHGVFLSVLGLGVLIMGPSGVGKSELALELITRGHRLIADDVVELKHVAPETLEGCCPPLIRDFLEVRGLGILNIRFLFGEMAVKPLKNLKLIVELVHPEEVGEVGLNRLDMVASTETILGVGIPKVRIPVAAGRNLAVLVEVAVRNHLLKRRGINPVEQFIKRQQAAIDGNS